MIQATLYCNREEDTVGFRIFGHAGFAEHGSDIVCAAVSVLVINTVNAVEKFTDAKLSKAQNEDEGYMEYHLKTMDVPEAKLLLNTLRLGLESIQSEFKQYLQVSYKEV